MTRNVAIQYASAGVCCIAVPIFSRRTPPPLTRRTPCGRLWRHHLRGRGLSRRTGPAYVGAGPVLVMRSFLQVLQAALHNLGLDQVGCAGLAQGYAGGNHHRIADLDCVLLTGHIHSQGEHPVGGIHLAGQVGGARPRRWQAAAGWTHSGTEPRWGRQGGSGK